MSICLPVNLYLPSLITFPLSLVYDLLYLDLQIFLRVKSCHVGIFFGNINSFPFSLSRLYIFSCWVSLLYFDICIIILSCNKNKNKNIQYVISFIEISMQEIFCPLCSLFCGNMVIIALSQLQEVMILFLEHCTGHSFSIYLNTCYVPGVYRNLQAPVRGRRQLLHCYVTSFFYLP